MKFDPKLSLNENLELLGYKTRGSDKEYKKEIFKDAIPLGLFTAREATEYLKEKHGTL